MLHNWENPGEHRISRGVLNLSEGFLQNLKLNTWKTADEARESLSGQEKYNKVKEIMNEKGIEESSLEWAKLFIENWLWYYVVATLKDFPMEIHDDIVDLLLLNHEWSLLAWPDNNMVVEFKGSAQKTLHKLYYTRQWLSFRGKTMENFDRLNENKQDIPNEVKWLREFEWNSIIRKLIIDELKKNEDWYLEYLFKKMKINDCKDLFTQEEITENQEFIDRLEKILK